MEYYKDKEAQKQPQLEESLRELEQDIKHLKSNRNVDDNNA